MLDTNQLCKKLNVSRQTLNRYISKGMPVHKDSKGSATGGGGRKRNMYELKEVQEWLAASGQTNSQQRVAMSVPSEPNQDVEVPTDAVIKQTAAKGSVDDLNGLVERLKAAEMSTYNTWIRARGRKGASAAEVGTWMKIWQETVEKRRRVEKDLPEMLKQRGIFVDVRAVSSVVTRAMTELSSQLKGLGISVAEELVGKSANEIRLIIDQRVDLLKNQMVQALGEHLKEEANSDD